VTLARSDRVLKDGRVLVYRTPLLVRITHWVNALCLVLLLGSGLQIFNAHPALYWGETSHFDSPLLAIGPKTLDDGTRIGVVAIGSFEADTTGLFGLVGEGARAQARAFPAWATLPGYKDLGAGRRWHFFFAWVFAITLAIYLAFNLISGRARRDLLPSGGELRGIGRSLWDHLRLRFEHARAYNVLQKLTYLAVGFVILPMIIVTGLCMSPSINATMPWLTDLFGGRQSARTIHFLCAFALVLFFLVHMAMVLLAGPLNEMRAIVTGWYKTHPASETPT
jgi:thiosulfate reductase cytochrome b subunit